MATLAEKIKKIRIWIIAGAIIGIGFVGGQLKFSDGGVVTTAQIDSIYTANVVKQEFTLGHTVVPIPDMIYDNTGDSAKADFEAKIDAQGDTTAHEFYFYHVGAGSPVKTNRTLWANGHRYDIPSIICNNPIKVFNIKTSADSVRINEHGWPTWYDTIADKYATLRLKEPGCKATVDAVSLIQVRFRMTVVQ